MNAHFEAEVVLMATCWNPDPAKFIVPREIEVKDTEIKDKLLGVLPNSIPQNQTVFFKDAMYAGLIRRKFNAKIDASLVT